MTNALIANTGMVGPAGRVLVSSDLCLIAYSSMVTMS